MKDKEKEIKYEMYLKVMTIQQLKKELKALKYELLELQEQKTRSRKRK